MTSSWMALAVAGFSMAAGACTTSDTVGLGADGGVLVRPDAPDGGSGARPDALPFIGFDIPEFFPDQGPPPVCGGTTGILCNDGESCQFSGDCAVGSICNTPDDPYFDPTEPQGVCVRVVCVRDADCRGGKVCSAERICVVPTCQSAFDCAPGDICSGGDCRPAPSAVASCEVLTHDTFVSPTRSVRLEARALDGAGQVLGGLVFQWTSSAPARVQVVGDVATGGGEIGVAEITASLTTTASIACTGRVRIENVTPVLSPSVRVRVVAAESGAPLVGARVIVQADGAQQELTLDASGLVVFPPPAGDVEWVTVLSAGREHVSVIAPGTRDLYIPLERAPTPQLAGGFRGAIDVSATPRGDMYVGLAGTALPLDLSRFRLSTLLGDPIESVINAPQLGFNDQPTVLPGNLVLRLGNERLTVDRSTTDLRCQGLDPGPTDLGCYVARAPAGPGVAWTFSTRLRLQDVASIAGRLSGALGEGPFDMVSILPEVMPLLRTAPSGVNASIQTTEVPRVDAVTGQASALCSSPNTPPDDSRCRADFARYTPVVLRADTPRGVHSVVDVPRLPSAGGQVPEAVLVVAAASSPHGLVPLGMTGARDDEASPDGLVEGPERPFGVFSAPLADGQVPLSSAVPHSGLEGLPLRLVAVAYDRALESGTGARMSGLIETPAQLAPSMGFGGRAFLGYASGVLDRSNATFVGTVPPGALTLRIELVRGGSAWRIYAPPNTTSLTLPAVMEARVELLAGGAAPEVSLQVIRARVGTRHADVFTRGSGISLDTLHTVTEAFSAQQCTEQAAALCRVR